MPTIKQFLLPDPAEGLTEADIVTWKVAVGDLVNVNQPIVDIETAKSLVELPSPYAGRVVEIHVPAGTTALVGSPIISIDVDPDGAPAAEQPAKPDATTAEPAADEARQPMLVGYGPKPGTPARRARRATPHSFGPRSGVASSAAPILQEAFSAQRPVATPVAPPRPPRPVVPVEGVARALPPTGQVRPPALAPDIRVLAKPPVRKLARDLGIDLASLTPSGEGGLITRDDVSAAASTRTVAPADSPNGLEERIPITGVRKLTAQAMVSSAFTAPHATEWVSVDVTRTVELLARLKQRVEFRDVKLSPLVLVAKALCLSIRRNPGVNATWNEPAGEIVIKHYVNLGIAAATPRGLIVPNIPRAETLDVRSLALALHDLAETARAGRTPPAALRGGTITITNVGVFGVDGGTPIINPGEAAILAMGQVRAMPWVVDGELAVRQVMQLSLSFDHRLIDGDLGSRFLADVAAVLEDPELGLIWT